MHGANHVTSECGKSKFCQAFGVPLLTTGCVLLVCSALPQVKALKNKAVILIGAGRYHTAMCTTTELYTIGKNLGQLGYEKTYDTQISPRTVSIRVFL